eukprot:2768289-Pyramimonas_sp.AAC.1
MYTPVAAPSRLCPQWSHLFALRGPVAALSGSLASPCGPYIRPSWPPVAHTLAGPTAAIRGPS